VLFFDALVQIPVFIKYNLVLPRNADEMTEYASSVSSRSESASVVGFLTAVGSFTSFTEVWTLFMSSNVSGTISYSYSCGGKHYVHIYIYIYTRKTET